MKPTINPLLSFFKKGVIEAGCDEAGRGCLAGPVFAAAVILPKNVNIVGLNDSKKLSEKQRYNLREEIIKTAICYYVSQVDNNEIDKINILWASVSAMQKSLDKLQITPEHIIVDGNKFKPYKNIPYTCIVKGDGKYQSIAAASVLAKTFRDDYMKELHNKFPDYNWLNNKGYPTAEHISALKKYGSTPFHRKTFHLKSEQLSLKF
ncbi:MAG: ribonuclease HII [Bacteroidetes bacterium CG02_land_8_20_14_3_00_31_25]|nr:MAG: ribonuclease HII [Bacteroidetes bacterium CG02_land_8_20_14_3_00_31_25]PIX34493.1 MAG: ribonuclease HII [Bacteroidetes bacterium CG_4_8_14_3_um_filter_31_14]